MPKRVHMNYTRVLIRCEILNRISSASGAAAPATRTPPAFAREILDKSVVIVHRDGSPTDDDIIPKVLSIYQVLREFIARLCQCVCVFVCE